MNYLIKWQKHSVPISSLVEYGPQAFGLSDFLIYADLGTKFLACNYSTSSFNELPEMNNLDSEKTTNTKRGVGPENVDPEKGYGFRGVHKVPILN